MNFTNLDLSLRGVWHPVAMLAEVTVEPKRVCVLGEFLVVVLLNGRASAFHDRCPHRNARLSDGCVVGGHLQCPYHGWKYDADGVCVHIPALGENAIIPSKARLDDVHLMERYDMLWVALDTPTTGIVDIAEFDDPALANVWMPPRTMNGGAAQYVDNFLDFAHFPFVHAGTFGLGESPLLDDYSVDRRAGGLHVEYHHTIANKEDPLVATGEHPLVQPRVMVYDCVAPFSANLRLELPMAGMTNSIAVFVRPETEHTSVVYCVMMRDDCWGDDGLVDAAKAQAAVDYEFDIVTEDFLVVERLASTAIPVERNAHVHTRVDRITVEYRRLLAELMTAS